MPVPIRVTSTVIVPADALELRASRASGPGGQNVNKVASKVELRVDLSRIVGLSPAARSRLQALTASRRGRDGVVVIRSQRTRDQHRNLEDAREKLRLLVERSLTVPRRRVATRVTSGAREARLRQKKKAGERKRDRRVVRPED